MTKILTWYVAKKYKINWTDDLINKLQRGFHFSPQIPINTYAILPTCTAARELGKIGSFIRNNNSVIGTSVTTRDILGCAKTRFINPQTLNQKKRYAITSVLIEQVDTWVHKYGSLTTKQPAFLDEWSTSIVMFEWIYEFIEQKQSNMVKIRIEYQENTYEVIPRNKAKIMIDDFINNRLEMLDDNTLLWALWKIAAHDLEA